MKKLLFLTSLLLLGVSPITFAEENSNTDALIKKMEAQSALLSKQVKNLNQEVVDLKKEQVKIKETKTIAPTKKPPVTYLSGTPVVIAPYLGNHSSFTPFDLVTFYSSYNQDLSLLKLKQYIFNKYVKNNHAAPTGPMLMVSGKIEAQGVYNQPYRGNHTSKFDLTSAELDLIPILNNWASGFVSFKYSNAPLQNMPLTSNSRVHVDQGFLTLGDLNKAPFYMTAGQFYMPFGRYNTSMINTPVTEMIFQTRARAFELGYQDQSDQGFFGQIYAFNGDSSTSHNQNINNVGANLGLRYSEEGKWNVGTGLGVISNVADSLGMQATGAATGFTGFSETNTPNVNSEILDRQVPGIAGHVNVGVGRYSLNAEYITAMSSFGYQDMTFNGAGAKPQALYAEGAYNFYVNTKPSAVLLGYGRSWQALAINVPQTQYKASFLTSVWKDTIQQIEFDHDINYQPNDSASGAGVSIPASSMGGSSNTVNLLLGVYF